MKKVKKEYYPGEKFLKEEIIWDDNSLHLKRYYFDGSLMSEFITNEKIPYGIEREYFESAGGEVYRETVFENENLDGAVKVFFKSGRIEYNYKVKAQLIDGEVKNYYENGVLAKESSWKNGSKKGLEKAYDIEGNLIRKTIWDNIIKVEEEEYIYE
ncbi:MAG: hypothetical protein MJH09_07730 [Cetobacterium sp.]|nr:hypothetical protein [Cetobacterium sp.]